MLLISVSQAVKELNLSRATIYRRIKNGEIRTLNSNGVIRIPTDQFTTGATEEKEKDIWR